MTDFVLRTKEIVLIKRSLERFSLIVVLSIPSSPGFGSLVQLRRKRSLLVGQWFSTPETEVYISLKTTKSGRRNETGITLIVERVLQRTQYRIEYTPKGKHHECVSGKRHSVNHRYNHQPNFFVMYFPNHDRRQNPQVTPRTLHKVRLFPLDDIEIRRGKNSKSRIEFTMTEFFQKKPVRSFSTRNLSSR